MRRRALLLLLLLPPRAQAAPLDDVMAQLAAVREGRASFVEDRVLPELDQPLTLRGTLHWIAPDRLEKRTLTPNEETLSVAGDRLLWLRPGENGRQEMSLDQAPEIRVLVEAIRSTLAGDLATLRRFYEVAFSGGPAGWRMVLTPLSTRVRGMVQRIEIAGRGAELRSVETQGQGGTTRMVIEPAR